MINAVSQITTAGNITSRPALSQFQSHTIGRSDDFLHFRNVVPRILKLQNCDRVGRDGEHLPNLRGLTLIWRKIIFKSYHPPQKGLSLRISWMRGSSADVASVKTHVHWYSRAFSSNCLPRKEKGKEETPTRWKEGRKYGKARLALQSGFCTVRQADGLWYRTQLPDWPFHNFRTSKIRRLADYMWSKTRPTLSRFWSFNIRRATFQN